MAEKLLRNLILVGLFAIPVLSFLLVPTSMFFPFITGKNFAFRIIVEIIGVLYVLLAYSNPEYRPKRTALLVAYAAFIVLISLADIFGQSFYRSFWSNYERMEGLIAHLHLFAYFVVLVSFLKKEETWEKLFHTFLGVGLFLGFYGVLQLNGEINIDQGTTRLDATLGNAIYFAVFLLYLLFIQAFLFLEERTNRFGSILITYLVGSSLFVFYSLYRLFTLAEKTQFGTLHTWFGWVAFAVIFLGGYILLRDRFLSDRVKKIATDVLHAILFVLNLVLLYYTASRGPILGLLAGGSLAALLFVVFSKGAARARKIVTGVLVAIILFTGIFAGLSNYQFIKQSPALSVLAPVSSFIHESPVLSRFASISFTERTTTSRFTIWNMSWEGFKEHPILGWGQDNFIYVFERYYKPVMWNQEPWFDRSHNVFFDWLIAGGALGLISYLSIFAVAIWYLWRPKREGTRGFTVADRGIFTGLLAGYFFQNLFVFDNLTSYILFFTVLAFIAFRVTFVETGENKKKEIKAIPLQLSVPLAAVLVVVLYIANVKPIMASQALILGGVSPRVASSTVRTVDGKTLDLPGKLAAFKEALSYNTFAEGEICEQMVQNGFQVAAREAQTPELNEFLTLARDEMLNHIKKTNGDIRYDYFLGSYLSRLGQPDQGIEFFKRALEVSPSKQIILFDMASAYLQKKDSENAFATLERAYKLDPEYPAAGAYYVFGAAIVGNDKLVKELLQKIPDLSLIPASAFLSAYLPQKKYEIPVIYLKARISKSADDSDKEAYLTLISVYRQAGNYSAASELVSQINKNHPDWKSDVDSVIKGK